MGRREFTVALWVLSLADAGPAAPVSRLARLDGFWGKPLADAARRLNATAQVGPRPWVRSKQVTAV